MNNDTSNAAVAARIREALNAEGYTQKEVAARLNLSPAQVSRLLSGKSNLRYDHIVTIGKFLAIKPRELLGIRTTTETILLTVTTAATKANRHRETIRKAIRAGHLPSSQVSERGHHRIREEDLTMWMAGAR